MWTYGVPDISMALQGATVLRFSSSLSRALFLSTMERYLAVVTALHYSNLEKNRDQTHPITRCITTLALTVLISLYFPFYLVAVLAYIIEFTIQTLLPIITFGRVSYTSLHRSFAQPYEVMDKSGLFRMQYLETEVIGEVSPFIYNACTKKRQWRGFWPIFYVPLAPEEETAIEANLEPLVRAVSEASGMRCTIMKAGRSLVQIGGTRLKKRASIADALQAEESISEQTISCSLGRMYDPYNIFYRINRVSLTTWACFPDSNVQATSDGEHVAKLVYRTRDYATAFQELAQQIQEYPLTIDISRSDGIEVTRTNIVLLKHMIGIAGSIIATAWFGFRSILIDKDVDRTAYVLAVYALWVNLGYVPVLGRDTINFTDIVRVKRKRVIEALLHNKSFLGTSVDGSSWNYRKTVGSTIVGPLSSEEAAITARMCRIDDTTIVALDSCSLRSHTGVGSTTDGLFEATEWVVDRTTVSFVGTRGPVK